jgi:hypothetical protein
MPIDKQTKETELRKSVVAQSIQEISTARTYKQGKVSNWKVNEEMYYGKKQLSDGSRANIDLARMQEFVHTLLSKIDNPLVFKFIKRKEAQMARVQMLNSLRQYDSQINFWDIKDLVGKKQGIIYGRSIYSYFADSIDGYQAHLDNVDVYDFLIDSAGGGIDIELADYMGRWGVIKTKQELQDGDYIKSEVDILILGQGNANDKNQEENNKIDRKLSSNSSANVVPTKTDKYKFWEWFTTYEGERYYLLMQENGICVRFEKLVDLFSPTKQFPRGAWPFWTWAAFPDLTEFWTPSYCDYVREIFQVQNVNINQMLDNAEEYNKPQKVVNVKAIESLAELKYRKDGYIRTKGDYDASRVIQVMRPSSIDTPLKVFEALENIQEKALGVTSGAKGVANEEGKATIYEGNQEASADRFGLLNKSYSFGYNRFAKLYEIGVRDNLTKKIAIDIVGPEGIETKEVGKNDIYHKGDDFGVMVEASNAEDMASAITMKNKMAALNGEIQIVKGVGSVYNPIINPQKAAEMKLRIAGFNDEEITELMDTDNYGKAKIMSEAARDIERLMDGERIEPNEIANNAYKQKLVDYGKDHREDMTNEQKSALIDYITRLEPVIMRNTAKMLNNEAIELMANQPVGVGGTGSTPQMPEGGQAEELQTSL